MGYNSRKKKIQLQKRSRSVDSDRSQGSSSSIISRESASGETTTTATDTASASASIWTFREKVQVLQFLKEYRKGCQTLYNGEMPDETKAKTIGDVPFPALTLDIFKAPYLKLSPSMRSKQRRMVHECCSEVGLYHISTGPSREERTIAITMYADGLSKDLDDKPVPHPMPIYLYRPWFCRKEREHDTTERRLRAKIDALIDQPGECLRDPLDNLDFEKWETADLSTFKMPPSQEESDDSLALVDTPAKMQQCIDELTAARPTEIGFDLESYNPSKHSQLTCLLQLTSNAGRDYVIDTLAPGVWDGVHGLAPLFADPAIVKVGHAIGGLDVRSLHRDFGIFVVNAFDTYEAAKVMGLDKKGLAGVCSHYNMPDTETYAALKAEYQSCDWRRRPLTPPMIQYGRYDVHYLLRLRWLMMRDLTRRDLWDRTTAEQQAEDERVGAAVVSTLAHFNQFEDDDEYWDNSGNLGSSFEMVPAQNAEGDAAGETSITRDVNDEGEGKEEEEERDPIASVQVLRLQPELMRVMSHSQQRCRDLWTEKKEAFINHPLRIHFAQQARRKELEWTTNNEDLLEKLVEWRNKTARELECLPGFVASLDILLPVALLRPTSETSLRRISYDLPEVLEYEASHREALFGVIAASVRASGKDPSHEVILLHSDIPPLSLRKRKHFPWAMAVLAVGAVGAAGVAVAYMSSRRRRRL